MRTDARTLAAKVHMATTIFTLLTLAEGKAREEKEKGRHEEKA